MAKDDWYFVISTVLGGLGLLGMDWKLVAGKVSMPASRRREILMLIAVLGSLAMSAAGWYQLNHLDVWHPTDVDKLEVIDGKHFVNEKVELDGKKYQNCTFTNVTLVLHGTTSYGLFHNTFSGGLTVQLDSGAAAGAIKLAKAIGWMRPDVPMTEQGIPISVN